MRSGRSRLEQLGQQGQCLGILTRLRLVHEHERGRSWLQKGSGRGKEAEVLENGDHMPDSFHKAPEAVGRLLAKMEKNGGQVRGIGAQIRHIGHIGTFCARQILHMSHGNDTVSRTL